MVRKPYEGSYYQGLWQDACRIGLPLSEFENHEPLELAAVFEGFWWRQRHLAIYRAYHIAALTTGTEDLPSLEELLSDEPVAAPEVSAEAYHERLRALGLE